jgi:uncharacterized protein (TIGR00369 family)
MSGKEFLTRIMDGRLPSPPMFEALDFHLATVGDGDVCFLGHPSARHYNPIGTVHGGYAATLLDSCMSCAVQTTLPQGGGYTTLELKVHLVRAITEQTGPITATGRVMHAGRRTATAEGKISDANGRLLAHGTTTCLILG